MATETSTVCFSPIVNYSKCLSSNMEWFKVTGTGKLISISKLSYGPVGFEGDVPYSIALLDYGDYKVFGRIDKGIPDEELSIRIPMKTQPVALPNGQLSYVFNKP